MSKQHRRQFLESLLGLAQAAGTVVLATSVLPAAQANVQTPEEEPADGDLQSRADQLAHAAGSTDSPEGDIPESFPVNFLNGGARVGGGFRKGGFTNGGFRNGGFRNGGWVNGGFRKGGFTNGGFRNGGFRNF